MDHSKSTGAPKPRKRVRERIAWTEVEGFAVDRPTGKPELVLAGGKRKRLAYVPDSAWIEIQQCWQQFTVPGSPSDIRSAIPPNGSAGPIP